MLHNTRLILGDNPFFGINHRHGSKIFSEGENLYSDAADVITLAASSGFSLFMLSAHEESRALIKCAYSKTPASSSLPLALVIPYPHTLNNLVAEHGFLKAALILLASGGGIFRDLSWILVPSFSSLRKIIISRFIRSELASFTSLGAKVETFCLHNVVTDLLIGLGREDVICDFVKVCQKLGLESVIITQNPISVFAIPHLPPCTVCFSYNMAGYMVNPSLESVRDSFSQYELSQRGIKLWAMQLLASGVISPGEAIDDQYLKSFDGVLYATTKKQRIVDFIASAKGS